MTPVLVFLGIPPGVWRWPAKANHVGRLLDLQRRVSYTRAGKAVDFRMGGVLTRRWGRGAAAGRRDSSASCACWGRPTSVVSLVLPDVPWASSARLMLERACDLDPAPRRRRSRRSPGTAAGRPGSAGLPLEDAVSPAGGLYIGVIPPIPLRRLRRRALGDHGRWGRLRSGSGHGLRAAHAGRGCGRHRAPASRSSITAPRSPASCRRAATGPWTWCWPPSLLTRRGPWGPSSGRGPPRRFPGRGAAGAAGT